MILCKIVQCNNTPPPLPTPAFPKIYQSNKQTKYRTETSSYEPLLEYSIFVSSPDDNSLFGPKMYTPWSLTRCLSGRFCAWGFSTTESVKYLIKATIEQLRNGSGLASCPDITVFNYVPITWYVLKRMQE